MSVILCFFFSTCQHLKSRLTIPISPSRPASCGFASAGVMFKAMAKLTIAGGSAGRHRKATSTSGGGSGDVELLRGSRDFNDAAVATEVDIPGSLEEWSNTDAEDFNSDVFAATYYGDAGAQRITHLNNVLSTLRDKADVEMRENVLVNHALFVKVGTEIAGLRDTVGELRSLVQVSSDAVDALLLEAEKSKASEHGVSCGLKQNKSFKVNSEELRIDGVRATDVSTCEKLVHELEQHVWEKAPHALLDTVKRVEFFVEMVRAGRSVAGLAKQGLGKHISKKNKNSRKQHLPVTKTQTDEHPLSVALREEETRRQIRGKDDDNEKSREADDANETETYEDQSEKTSEPNENIIENTNATDDPVAVRLLLRAVEVSLKKAQTMLTAVVADSIADPVQRAAAVQALRDRFGNEGADSARKAVVAHAIKRAQKSRLDAETSERTLSISLLKEQSQVLVNGNTNSNAPYVPLRGVGFALSHCEDFFSAARSAVVEMSLIDEDEATDGGFAKEIINGLSTTAKLWARNNAFSGFTIVETDAFAECFAQRCLRTDETSDKILEGNSESIAESVSENDPSIRLSLDLLFAHMDALAAGVPSIGPRIRRRVCEKLFRSECENAGEAEEALRGM